MIEGKWTRESHRVLREHFRTMPFCLTEQELRRRMRPWYPFPERKNWPYKCWLRACRQWREAYFQGRTEVIISRRRRKTIVDRDTLPLWPGLERSTRRR